MNYKVPFTTIVLIMLICFSATTLSAESKRGSWLSLSEDSKTTSKISVGARMHFDYKEFDKIPLQEDDLSYLLFYEVHNEFAYWQVGGAFTPGPSDDRFDHILTPQLNLIIKDRFYRLGLGALSSNIKVDGDSDWSRVYYQLIFGFGIPIGEHFGIDLYGHYVFKSINKPVEPASESPEISLLVNFAF